MEHIKVSSVSEAWRAAARIFPTDYEKNEENSKRAGYPIYETTSTDERFSGFHISDLNTRLEVNMGNETVTIWIEEDAFEIVVKGLTEEEKESLRTGGQTDGSRTYIANRGSSHIECITAIHPNSDAARETPYRNSGADVINMDLSHFGETACRLFRKRHTGRT